MLNRIGFAAFSDPGEIREKNQDNLYCGKGKYLPEQNHGTEGIWSGKVPHSGETFFSVFDGMGGEKAGETASYIAARKLEKMIEERKPWHRLSGHDRFLEDYCRLSGNEIDLFRKEKKYRAMGTTTAIIMITGNKVLACNVGDTRIYRYSKGKLSQISEDHVEKSSLFRNAPLTQYLGVSEQEMRIEPMVTERRYSLGDRYLICSDGVWRTAAEPVLGEIMNSTKDDVESMMNLKQWVERKDGTDNASAVLISLC